MTWPVYPQSPYGDEIDLSDWGWLFDYSNEATIPWGYQAPAPFAPYQGYTQPFQQTVTVPQRASVMAPGAWTEIPRQEPTREGLSWWQRGPAAAWRLRQPSVAALQEMGRVYPGMGLGAAYQAGSEAFERERAQLGLSPYGVPYPRAETGPYGQEWIQGPTGWTPSGTGAAGASAMGAAAPSWTVPGGPYGAGTYGAGPAAASAEAAERAGTYGPQQAQATQQQVVQAATAGLPGHDEAWAREFEAKHGMGWQEFYSRPENERGAGGPEAALYRDYQRSQSYMQYTGKTSLTDDDWRNIYYGVAPGGGGGGGGGGEVAAAGAVPKYQVPAMRYQGPQTTLTMPSGALGTIGAVGRQAVEDILRGRGWQPSGVMGRYGWGEYTRKAPRRVWFQPRLFKGAGAKAAERLFRKLEWTPPKKKRAKK